MFKSNNVVNLQDTPLAKLKQAEREIRKAIREKEGSERKARNVKIGITVSAFATLAALFAVAASVLTTSKDE